MMHGKGNTIRHRTILKQFYIINSLSNLYVRVPEKNEIGSKLACTQLLKFYISCDSFRKIVNIVI
jgi:hypothetical protein